MKKEKIGFLILLWLALSLNSFPDTGTITLKTSDLQECLEVFSFIQNTKGEFFLFSRKTLKIFKFDAQGNFVKSFCRAGEGPGEVKRVLTMSHNPANDFLYLPEYASGIGRISTFDSEGNFKGYMNIPLTHEQKDNILRFFFLNDGSYYVSLSERINWKPHGDLYLTEDRLTVYCIAQDGKTKTEIFQAIQNNELSNQPRYGGPNILFQSSILVRLTPEGHICVTKNDQNELKIYDRSGKRVKTITLDIQPVPLDEKEFEKAREELVGYFKEGDRMQWLAKHMIKLKYKPIYHNLFVRENDYVLSQITQEDEDGYPRASSLAFFDHQGKKISEKKVPGYVLSLDEKNLFIKEYDDEGNERFRLEQLK